MRLPREQAYCELWYEVCGHVQADLDGVHGTVPGSGVLFVRDCRPG